MLDSFCIGKLEDTPDDIAKWCEIWIRYDDSSFDDTLSDVEECCNALEIEIDDNKLFFPERIVRLIKANKTQLFGLISCSQYIAEFRRAPEPTSFFDNLSGAEQQEWVEELLERTEFKNSNSYICLLDTGLNSAHPLISPAVEGEDAVQAVDKTWGTNEHMGLKWLEFVIYNDLKSKLLENNSVDVRYKIEFVKILPPKGENPIKLYGAITEQAVALAEISNPIFISDGNVFHQSFRILNILILVFFIV